MPITLRQQPPALLQRGAIAMSTNSTTKKRRAHLLVGRAVADNTLPRISKTKCHDCGKQAEHYHHEDYDKPLAVIQLCAKCHSKRHDKREVKPDPPFKPGLLSWRAVYASMPTDTTLVQFLKAQRKYFISIYAMSQHAELSHGLITHVLNGKLEDSPTLRKQLKIRKWPKRNRLIINCPPHVAARFHAQRGDKTPAEHQVNLMDLKDGEGELP